MDSQRDAAVRGDAGLWRARRRDAEPHRRRKWTSLHDALDAEPGAGELREKFAERHMPHPDPEPHASTHEPPLGREVPRRDENAAILGPARRGSCETGMHRNRDEATAGTEHSCCFCEGRSNVIDVGVREGGAHRVEPRVGEGKRSGIRERKTATPLGGKAEHVLRQIERAHRPTERLDQRQLVPHAAPVVQAGTVARTQQVDHRLGSHAVAVLLEVRLVPLSPPVVRSFRHERSVTLWMSDDPKANEDIDT